MSRDDAEKSRLRRCYVLLCLPTAWARSSQQRVAAFIAAAALFLVALGSLSRDAVPINHLDAARAYFDRRDVLYSRWAEAGFFWTATAAVPIIVSISSAKSTLPLPIGSFVSPLWNAAICNGEDVSSLNEPRKSWTCHAWDRQRRVRRSRMCRVMAVGWRRLEGSQRAGVPHSRAG